MINDTETRELILSGNFEKIAIDHNNPTFSKFCEMVLCLAFETGSLCCYGYFEYLIRNNNLAIYHYHASLILSSALCHYAGAYQIAYFHAKEASKINPTDISYKEFLLFFYNTPEKLMTIKKCQTLINDILKLDPINETALKILKENKDVFLNESNMK